MTNIYKKFVTIVCFVMLVSGLQHAFAQNNAVDSTNKHPVIEMMLSPEKLDTTFSTNAFYSVHLMSTFSTPQAGTLSYILTTASGKKVKTGSMKIKMGEGCQASYDFSIPTVPSGAYKINFAVAVPGHQDTINSRFFIKSDEAQKDSSINLTVLPHSTDGVFATRASYTLNVVNTFPSAQQATLSYLVMTEKGKKIKADSIHVKLGTKASAHYDFDIPPVAPGFYKINFMVNVPDYTDTIRKAFGIRPEQVRSQYAKPADFEAFWQQAKAELATVKPEYHVTEIPNCQDNRRVFKVEMRSLGGLLIRGFLTEPRTTVKNKKFAVLLALPGYQVQLGPMLGNDPDIAIFTINTRGSGYSRDVINVRRETFIVLNLEDKNRYVMRGVIMDCVRAVDFICSRPELRKNNIIAAGGSQGGLLAIATSALDKRISFCSAANPIFCDVRNLPGEVDWPLIDFHKYVATRPGLTMDSVFNNLDYFDTKNFASDIKCKTLVGLGMLDNIAPPDHVYAMYNELHTDKHIIIFRDLAHEIGKSYNVYEGRWMRDTFALF